MPKYVVDTQLLIRAMRDPLDAARYAEFVAGFSSSVYLCSVVAQELLAGSRQRETRGMLRTYIEPFEELGRTATPCHQTWRQTGQVLNALRARGFTITASFANDVLIACTARQIGAVVVHDNLEDYRAIQQIVSFKHVSGYPGARAA